MPTDIRNECMRSLKEAEADWLRDYEGNQADRIAKVWAIILTSFDREAD